MVSAACLNYHEGRRGRHPSQLEEEDVCAKVCRTGTVLGIAIGESRFGDRVLRRDGGFPHYLALVVQNFDDLAVNSGFEDEFAVGACPLRKDIGAAGGRGGGGGGPPDFPSRIFLASSLNQESDGGPAGVWAMDQT